MASPRSPDSPAHEPGAESPSSEVSSPVSTPSPSVESPTTFPPSQNPDPKPYNANMTASSTPLGAINAARAPPQPTMGRRGVNNLPDDVRAKMANFHLSRQNSGSVASPVSASPRMGPGGIPSNFVMPPSAMRPTPSNSNSSPAIPNARNSPKPSLAQKRGLAMPGGLPGAQSGAAQPPGRKRPGLKLSDMNQADDADSQGSGAISTQKANGGSLMDKYADYIDIKTGSLRFKGKATLTSQGVQFSSGTSFDISLDEVDTMDELGKGNYGTVYKVRHSRPRLRKVGMGLAGNKAPPPLPGASPTVSSFPDAAGSANTSGVVMAMKEIRLELDDAKFAAIIMELDILHRCVSPHIIDFYGAFFQEGAVYICMEFMDGGSIDKLYSDGIPENVLRKIAFSTVKGLKSLKEDHNIIHRDVKPTNILINTKGQVKICDFGVSGNLVASIAKTNIGCQSYMAPERISSGGVAQAGANPGGGTYSVQSDIWSLGLTIIECALGQYPYPPETYDNIFSQLSAIVDGEPPDLPQESFSDAAHDFVHGCLMKIPKLRPTYALLMQHAWLAPLAKPETISEEDEDAAEAGQELSVDRGTEDQEVADWVKAAIEKKRQGKLASKAKPALHAAPLDVVSSNPQVETSPVTGALDPSAQGVEIAGGS